MCVYCRKPFGAHPLLQRFTVFQRLKLALPDLTDQYQGAIRTSEPFFFSELQRALADLRRIVLNPNDVGPLGAIDVLNANIAAQNRFTDFSRRAAEFSGSRFMAVLVSFALFAVQNMRHVELKTCMIVVVHWHSPGEMITVALSEAEYVGLSVLGDIHTAAGEARGEQHSPLAFLYRDIRDFRRAVHVKL